MRARLRSKAFVLPPLGLAVLLAWSVVDVPWWDQWEMVPLLSAWHDGAGWGGLVLTPHNEHVMLLPRLVMLGLARLTAWDVRAECALSFLLSVGLFLTLRHQMKRTLRGLGAGDIARETLLLSVILFSPVQWENWLWGWQLAYWMGTLFGVASLFGLHRALVVFESPRTEAPGTKTGDRRSLPSWPAALGPSAGKRRKGRATSLRPGSGTGASALAAGCSGLCFAQGLLVWPAGLYLLREARWPLRESLLWGGAGLACWAYALGAGSGLPPPPGPVDAALYSLSLLGGYFALSAVLSPLAGGIVLGALGWLAAQVARRPHGDAARTAAAPWIGLILFVLLAGLSTAWGRATLGIAQARASRYTTLTAVLLAALGVLWRLVRKVRYSAPPSRGGRWGQSLSFQEAHIAEFVPGKGKGGTVLGSPGSPPGPRQGQRARVPPRRRHGRNDSQRSPITGVRREEVDESRRTPGSLPATEWPGARSGERQSESSEFTQCNPGTPWQGDHPVRSPCSPCLRGGGRMADRSVRGVVATGPGGSNLAGPLGSPRAVAVVAAVLVLAYGYGVGTVTLHIHSTRMSAFRSALADLGHAPAEALHEGYPRLDVLRERARTLQRLRWSVYRDGATDVAFRHGGAETAE